MTPSLNPNLRNAARRLALALGLMALVMLVLACGPSAPAVQEQTADPTAKPTAEANPPEAEPTKLTEEAKPTIPNTPTTTPTPTMSPQERADQEEPTPTPTPVPTISPEGSTEADILPPIPTSVDFCYGLNRWEDGPEFFKYEPGCLYLYEKTAHENCGITATAWHSNDFLTDEEQACLKLEYADVDDYIHRVRLGYGCLAADNSTRKQYVNCKQADDDQASEAIKDLFIAQQRIMTAVQQSVAVVQAEERVNTCLEGLDKEFPEINFGSSQTVYWLDSLTIPFPPFMRTWTESKGDSRRLEKVIAYTDRVHQCAEKAGYYTALHESFVAELIRLSRMEPSPVESMKLTGLADYRLAAGPSQFAPRPRQ